MKHDEWYTYNNRKTHYVTRDMAGYAFGITLCNGRVEQEDLKEPNYDDVCENCKSRAKKLRII